MKYITETFKYTVPDNCEEFITIQDYIYANENATCPFYDDCNEYVPDEIEREILVE